MAHPYWPLFDLEVRTPRLVMRSVDDELAVELAALAAKGIHDPDFMPFAHPWSRNESPKLEQQALQFYWRCRASAVPTSWSMPLAVIVDGTVVGTSDLLASEFPRMRQFETGSWLGRGYQGRGIGKEMRLASLTLGFVGFGAEWATTAAWHDNGPSLGVTRSLGYTRAGARRQLRDDREPDRLIGFEMPRDHFEANLRRDDIELIGVDAVKDWLEIP